MPQIIAAFQSIGKEDLVIECHTFMEVGGSCYELQVKAVALKLFLFHWQQCQIVSEFCRTFSFLMQAFACGFGELVGTCQFPIGPKLYWTLGKNTCHCLTITQRTQYSRAPISRFEI